MEANDSKQYGLYHGDFFKDPEFPKTCSEQNLYFIINNIGGFIWQMNHDMADGRIEENVALNSEQYAIEYCVMQTRRFGVEIPDPKDGEHVERTASYNAWFRWWDSYFQNELSFEEWDEYQSLQSQGKDVSHYRPQGDWRDSIAG